MSQTPSWEKVFSSQYQSPAEKVYCIAFTPRSGSTWLGDILTQSGRLGEPREYFNMDAAWLTVRRSACYNLADYYQYLKTMLQTEGTFGFEATLRQLSEAIKAESEDLFDDVEAWFFLRRKDYVAQAVSLYRADSTGVFHATDANEKVPEVPYDGNKIASTALNILASEFGMNKWLDGRGVSPVPLWYEDLIVADPAAIQGLFYKHIGLPPRAADEGVSEKVKPQFSKLADDYSAHLTARFKEENPSFVSHWDEMRGEESVLKFITKNPKYATGGLAARFID